MTRGRIRWTALRAAAVLVFTALAGATYQGVATALERREHPRPGGMVDVGDHQLHIYCLGSGLPTVVLEAPAAGLSAAWASVQPEVAGATRVCSYDRAGLGWSERSDAPYDPAAVAGELRTLLDRANEQGPFVVAGHGLGAAFARLFASRFGGDTSALILVDAPVAGQPPLAPAALTRWPASLPWLARVGVLRASGMLSSMAADLPSPNALTTFLNRPDHLSRTADELSGWEDVATRAARAPLRPGVSITRLEVFGPRRVGFPGPESGAARVVTAILDAVHAGRKATLDDGRLAPE